MSTFEMLCRFDFASRKIYCAAPKPPPIRGLNSPVDCLEVILAKPHDPKSTCVKIGTYCIWGAPYFRRMRLHAQHFSRFVCTISSAACKRRGQTKVFPLLLIPLLFLAAVRRFSMKSYTDIGLLPGYDWVDVSVLDAIKKWCAAK